MLNELFLFFSCAVLTVVLGIIQRAGIGEMWGLSFNLVLTSVVASSLLLKNFWQYLLVSVLGISLLKFYPGWDRETFILTIIFFMFFLLKKFLLWRSFPNLFFLTAFGVIIFYALTDFNYFSANYYYVAIEIIFDFLLASSFYFTLRKLFS